MLYRQFYYIEEIVWNCMFIFRYNRVNKLGKKFLYKFDLEIEQIKVLNQNKKQLVMSKKNNFPMWGGNKWTKSMFKKYWFVLCLMIVGYVLIVITANSSI